MKEIHLPGKLKVIRGRIFSGCVNLRNLVIPDSVEKIEPLAFYHAYGLTKVTIGKGVKEIGNNILLGIQNGLAALQRKVLNRVLI